jgi:ferric-dicitrate binding protein FerR (iron transport regulator)
MTRTERKLPIDSLPDEAWKRIRAQVFTELESHPSEPAAAGKTDGDSWLPRWGAVAALLLLPVAALAVVFALRLTRPAENASRVVTLGNVTRATVGDATLEVAPESEFVATGSEAEGWMVVVERGRVQFSVPERVGRRSFRVRAGHADIEVVGTRFTVLRAGDSVAVDVEHGVVRIESRSDVRLLHGGEHWESIPVAAPASAVTRAAPDVAKNEPIEPPVPGHPTATGVSSVGDRSLAPAPGVQHVPTRRERYEAASRLEVSEPGRAVELYLELGKATDAWAANALYAAGRVEFERRRLPQAKSLFQQYLRRFPTGQNAQEARTLLERTE